MSRIRGLGLGQVRWVLRYVLEGIVTLCCYGKNVICNKRRNNAKWLNHAGYERKNDVMLYCYEKIKRENTVPKSCVIRIAVAVCLAFALSPKLNMPKKRNNITIPRQPAWLSHLYRYVLTL